MKLFEEGGLADDGARVEPVTGNEVPPGSMRQEVRDDVDAKLSEGEYVVPADVVRYYGVRFFEDLRSKAKEDFSRMESEGRIGGEPVSQDGVPMGDEELTPEEMQMLAEALGQAPTGMAMGGMVTPDPYQQQRMQYAQPVGMAEGGLTPVSPFDPSQYSFGPAPSFGGASGSGGLQVKEYINVETGDTRLVSFMNGQPMQEIPSGFVLKTPEATEQARKNTQAVDTKTEGTTDVTDPLSPGNDSESDQRRAEQAEQREKENSSYTSWAEQNVDKIDEDPVGFVEDLLEPGLKEKAIQKGAGLVGGMIGGLAGVGVAGAGKVFSELDPLAKARAVRNDMAGRGLDTTKVDSLLKDYTEDLSPLSDFVDEKWAAGTSYLNGLSSVRSGSAVTSEKSKTKLNVPSLSKKDPTEDSAAEQRYKDFQKDYEANVKDAQENEYGQTTGKGLTVEDIEDSLTPMAEGGLVAKPSNYKSKVTRKKENKRRGLGSK